MRIVLIYPTISKFERYSSSIGSSGGSQLPLGILYLAGYMREHGHEVMAIDGEANNLTTGQVLDRIGSFAPQLVGISSSTVVFSRAVELAKEIKGLHPELTIVIGGPHVSSNPYLAMAFREMDLGVMGEGEETLLELVQVLENQGDFSRVKGLVYRDGEELHINHPRPYISDLDQLPLPAYDMIPDLLLYAPPPCNYKKLPVVNIITSRGCPNQCTFCDKNVFGSRFRARSAVNIAGEIEHLFQQYGVREIAFVDDTFTVGKKRVYELFDLLKQRIISFPWTCMTHIKSVDSDLIKYMKANGCWHVSLGIESGDEQILRRIKKDISLDQVRRVVRWCREAGIKTKGFFIVGHPGETMETIDKTIDFAVSLPLDDVVATINTPIPGSPQYQETSQFGDLDESDWSQFNYWRPVFVPAGLTKEVLLEKHREFYRRFYVRPRIMARYAASFFSSGGLRRALSLVRSVPFLFKRPSQ
ncbi:B12-binding domain-containing radical SAM protein [Thermodesulfobacteriota bacterium]